MPQGDDCDRCHDPRQLSARFLVVTADANIVRLPPNGRTFSSVDVQTTSAGRSWGPARPHVVGTRLWAQCGGYVAVRHQMRSVPRATTQDLNTMTDRAGRFTQTAIQISVPGRLPLAAQVSSEPPLLWVYPWVKWSGPALPRLGRHLTAASSFRSCPAPRRRVQVHRLGNRLFLKLPSRCDTMPNWSDSLSALRVLALPDRLA
jgi:hypothetical protein